LKKSPLFMVCVLIVHHWLQIIFARETKAAAAAMQEFLIQSIDVVPDSTCSPRQERRLVAAAFEEKGSVTIVLHVKLGKSLGHWGALFRDSDDDVCVSTEVGLIQLDKELHVEDLLVGIAVTVDLKHDSDHIKPESRKLFDGVGLHCDVVIFEVLHQTRHAGVALFDFSPVAPFGLLFALRTTETNNEEKGMGLRCSWNF